MAGGVLYIRDNDGMATVKIYNSNFFNNTAYREGGVIYNKAKLEINNSQFKYNIAEFGNGGAIVNNEGNMIIKSSNITSNKLESYSGTRLIHLHLTMEMVEEYSKNQNINYFKFHYKS